MQYEAAALLHRTAPHYRALSDRVGQANDGVRIPQVEFVQNIGKAQIGQLVIDHQPHCPFFAVADNQDDAFGEALVAHVGHRHQELSFE
ncbi:hypothetical protein D3C72_2307750 [compost metagenome]